MKNTFLTLLFLLATYGTNLRGAAQPGSPWPPRPYRALLVVERWDDPASVLVDRQEDDFQPVAALLKAWSVPFDILRLDQQHLDATYLFSRSGEVRYGVVLWLADSPSYESQNLTALGQAVGGGTSLFVVASRFLDPALEHLLALKFKSAYSATDPLEVSRPHFITRNLAKQKMARLDVSDDTSVRLWVETRGAEVLIDQNGHPVLTANRARGETPTVWLGVPSLTQLRDSGFWRDIFFRSLIWCLGYLVQPDIDYTRSIVLEIDDWGTADKGFLSYWRYATPSEDTIRQHLIGPLAKRRAVVTANVVPGYIDRKSGRVVSPWAQEFTDRFGVHQDYASTQKGLKAALAAGVLEIQSHGWTHMEPDLESPPGPWWTADLAGEASAIGWYAEFADDRRGKEIPAIVQLFHMKRALECLQADFGQSPLSLRPGNGAWSTSYQNNTARLAAQAGFGLFHREPDSVYYLDRSIVLDMTGVVPEEKAAYDRPLLAEGWPVHPDGPVYLTFHDRDISLQPDFLERLFAALPAGLKTLSTNQYIGALHTGIHSSRAYGWKLTFHFDEHYCAYYGEHASAWRLWLADPVLERLRAVRRLRISIDNDPVVTLDSGDFLHASVIIEIPAGLGNHVWRIEPAK